MDASTAEAARIAADAAGQAGARVVELRGTDACGHAAELFRVVWATGDRPPISKDVLRALEHAGNYLAGVYDGERLVAASAGFFARMNGTLALHSHITGVVGTHQGRRLGFALKQHQRAWSLERGIDVVYWTFDALVRRNAFFNLQKLGADIEAYEPNFYGVMEDAINAGDESDRCVVAWRLRSRRAGDAAAGRLDVPSDEVEGSEVLGASASGEPVVSDAASDVLLCLVPPDVVTLRLSDPALAKAWRSALRDTLGAALRDGYGVAGMTRSGRYVLTRS